MKQVLPMICLALSSCSSYQYLTLSSEQLSKNEKKELVWENDSLVISFNFNGSWGTFDITTLNKTGGAVSLSWVKSAIVYNGKAYSLFDESVSIQGDVQRNQLYEAKPVFIKEDPLATVKADVRVPKEMDFMPPNSSVTRQDINVFKLVPVTPTLTEDIPVEKASYDGINVKFRKANFDASSSPFKFSIYLTFVNSEGKEFYFHQPFYVSAIKQTDESSLHRVLIDGDGDKFYKRVTQ